MDARAGFEDAVRRYRDVDLPFQVAAAAISAAYTLGVGDTGMKALVDDGRAILVRLDAPPMLRILDRALGETGAPAPEVGPVTVDPGAVPAAD
jgi:hypothetical protein